MTLGEKIKQLRKDSKLSQASFGEKLSVSGPYISMVESNKEIPSDIFLKLAALEFNVSLDWLLGKTEEKQIDMNKYDYFERNISNNEYKEDIEKTLVSLLSTMPKESTIYLLSILNELAHILKLENIPTSKKTLVIDILASICISFSELIDKAVICNFEDELEVKRFVTSFQDIGNDIIKNLVKTKELFSNET